MIKRLAFISLVLLSPLFCMYSQPGSSYDAFGRPLPSTPRWAVKSNLLYDATATLNLGVEFKLGRKFTVDIPFNYNPWTFSDNKKWKHLLVQPELRYWLCEPFYGHFLGIHGHYGTYNVGGLSFGGPLKHYRYEGWLAGGGVSYGYHWMLSDRWSLEGSIGMGYAYLKYDKYDCARCGDLLGKDRRNYFGVTKAAISLIYVIK